MTKTEQQKMRRLEIENEQLKAAISRHMRVYGDHLAEIIELKATLQLIREALGLH